MMVDPGGEFRSVFVLFYMVQKTNTSPGGARHVRTPQLVEFAEF